MLFRPARGLASVAPAPLAQLFAGPLHARVARAVRGDQAALSRSTRWAGKTAAINRGLVTIRDPVVTGCNITDSGVAPAASTIFVVSAIGSISTRTADLGAAVGSCPVERVTIDLAVVALDVPAPAIHALAPTAVFVSGAGLPVTTRLHARAAAVDRNLVAVLLAVHAGYGPAPVL